MNHAITVLAYVVLGLLALLAIITRVREHLDETERARRVRVFCESCDVRLRYSGWDFSFHCPSCGGHIHKEEEVTAKVHRDANYQVTRISVPVRHPSREESHALDSVEA